MVQEFVDILYKFQCCLTNKSKDLIKLSEVGNLCYEKEEEKLKEMIIYFKALKNQILLETENHIEYSCLQKNNIENIINKLKLFCKECCIETDFLEIEE